MMRYFIRFPALLPYNAALSSLASRTYGLRYFMERSTDFHCVFMLLADSAQLQPGAEQKFQKSGRRRVNDQKEWGRPYTT